MHENHLSEHHAVCSGGGGGGDGGCDCRFLAYLAVNGMGSIPAVSYLSSSLHGHTPSGCMLTVRCQDWGFFYSFLIPAVAMLCAVCVFLAGVSSTFKYTEVMSSANDDR